MGSNDYKLENLTRVRNSFAESEPHASVPLQFTGSVQPQTGRTGLPALCTNLLSNLCSMDG